MSVLSFAALSMHIAAGELVVAAALVLGVAVAVREWRAGRMRRDGGGVLKALAPLAGAMVAVVACAPLLLARLAVMRGVTVAPVAFEVGSRYFALVPGVVFRRPEWFWTRYGVAALVGAFPAAIVGLAGIGLAVVMAVEAWRGDEPTWTALGVVALPMVLEVPPVSWLFLARSPYMFVRLAEVADAFALLGVAWAFSRERAFATRRVAGALGVTAVAVGLAFAVPGVLSVYTSVVPARVSAAESVPEMWARQEDGLWRGDTGARLRALCASHPRIGGCTATTYEMLTQATFSVASAPAQHDPFFVEARTGPQRREDMATLVASTTPAAVRNGIVQRYSLDFVAVSSVMPDYAAALRALKATGDYSVALDAPGLTVLRPIGR